MKLFWYENWLAVRSCGDCDCNSRIENHLIRFACGSDWLIDIRIEANDAMRVSVSWESPLGQFAFNSKTCGHYSDTQKIDRCVSVSRPGFVCTHVTVDQCVLCCVDDIFHTGFSHCNSFSIRVNSSSDRAVQRDEHISSRAPNKFYALTDRPFFFPLRRKITRDGDNWLDKSIYSI